MTRSCRGTACQSVMYSLSIVLPCIHDYPATRARFKIQASNKWVHSFMQRRGLSLRLATTNKELSTPAMQTILFHWRNKFAELFRSTPGHLLYNMDETSVYLDAPATRTVERIGARLVEIGTTKHELDRVAGCCASVEQARWSLRCSSSSATRRR
jgi:hypothetical protein